VAFSCWALTTRENPFSFPDWVGSSNPKTRFIKRKTLNEVKIRWIGPFFTYLCLPRLNLRPWITQLNNVWWLWIGIVAGACPKERGPSLGMTFCVMEKVNVEMQSRKGMGSISYALPIVVYVLSPHALRTTDNGKVKRKYARSILLRTSWDNYYWLMISYDG